MIVRRIDVRDPDAETVASLVDQSFHYYGGPYWKWKYTADLAPPAVVIVGDDDGDIVGCGHYLEIPYSLGTSGSLRGFAMGDLLVRPDRRGRGVSSQISTQGRTIAIRAQPGTAIVVMFTRELGSHLRNLVGYTPVRAEIKTWAKRLSWNRQLVNLFDESERLATKHRKLSSVDHVFRLELDGCPPLEFLVDSEGFRPNNGSTLPRFSIKTTEMAIFGNSRQVPGRVLRAAIHGRFRISGSPRAMMQATTVWRAYIDLLRILRS